MDMIFSAGFFQLWYGAQSQGLGPGICQSMKFEEMNKLGDDQGLHQYTKGELDLNLQLNQVHY